MTPVPISTDILSGKEKFLLYGEPKRGKTFTALTAPGPIYFLGIGGTNEAKTYYSEQFQRKHGKKEIFIDAATEDWSKGRVIEPKGFDRACILLDEALELDDKGEMEFETIIIDNATVLSEFQMYKVIEIDHLGTDDPEKATIYKKYVENGILTPHDLHWGGAQSLMGKFISHLFSLDKNIVLIAHEHQTTRANRKTRETSTLAVKPLFIGQQRSRIANMFDNVWRFYKRGQLYCARTTPLDSPFDIIAGTRVGGIISDEYQNPDISDAIDQFQAHAKEVE